MSVISVTSVVADLVEPFPGADVVTWDLDTEPPRDDIEVVLVPQFGAASVAHRLRDLPKLRAVLLSTAGYDHMVEFIPPGVMMANAAGVHDTATAEMALTLALAAQRDIPEFVRAQDEGAWVPTRMHRSLAGCQVLMVGYGGIGRAVASRMLACEAEVTAVASRARAGDELVPAVHPVGDLAELLPTADVVVLAPPLTESTRGLLNARTLALLPDDALVVNVGRGPLIDTEALIVECAAGRLRAALDVTDPEPLPTDHPLWSTPNVLVSPHTGGASTIFPARLTTYLHRQVQQYLDTGQIDHVVHVGADEPTTGRAEEAS